MSFASDTSAHLPPSKSPLAQVRAAHAALAEFIERRFAELSEQARRTGGTVADRQLAELTALYGNLERQLDADRAEAAQRPAPREELAGVHAALADSRQQNESLRQQLAAARASEERLRASLTEIQFEQRSLMDQLHTLQYRAAELADELSRERQHAAAERNLWHGELAHWRRLLESQFARPGFSQRAVSDSRAFVPPATQTPQVDAMLQSILVDCHMIEHHPTSDS